MSFYLNDDLISLECNIVNKQIQYKSTYNLNRFDFKVCYTNLQGQLHRTDGPAIEFESGMKMWYLNGKLHRDGGPAIVGTAYNQLYRVWYQNGKRHRVDGPAVIAWFGKHWYLNGVQQHRN